MLIVIDREAPKTFALTEVSCHELRLGIELRLIGETNGSDLTQLGFYAH